MNDHYTTTRRLLPLNPTPSPTLTRMIERAEEASVRSLFLSPSIDLSRYTNVELDTVETAARAERRRRWLSTVPENIKRRMDRRGDPSPPKKQSRFLPGEKRRMDGSLTTGPLYELKANDGE